MLRRGQRGCLWSRNERTRLRVEGSGWTYAEEAKSSTVVEDERHTGVLWGERPRLEKEVKLRNLLRKTWWERAMAGKHNL